MEKWDSLNHINLVLALEKEFQATFTQEEVFAMVSFEEILKVLNQKN